MNVHDPFAADIAHDNHRVYAVKLYGEIVRANPDCDKRAVTACLDHWLRCQAMIARIARHIEELDATAKQLASQASGLARFQHGMTAAVLNAALRKN